MLSAAAPSSAVAPANSRPAQAARVARLGGGQASGGGTASGMAGSNTRGCGGGGGGGGASSGSRTRRQDWSARAAVAYGEAAAVLRTCWGPGHRDVVALGQLEQWASAFG